MWKSEAGKMKAYVFSETSLNCTLVPNLLFHEILFFIASRLLDTEGCVLNHHNRTGSFKMERFEIVCSDPFTHQPGEWHLTSRCGSSFGFVL